MPVKCTAHKIKAFPDINLRGLGRRFAGETIISDNCFYPFASGRAAVYAAARMLAGSHRTVHMPAYHCGVEVEGFLRAGFEVRFYPVDASLTIDLEILGEVPWKPGDIFFAIHYFGFPQPMEDLSIFCRERDLVLIEDCAHGLYSQTDGRYLGRFGELAVFSMRKTIALPNGGGLLVNGSTLPVPPKAKKRWIPALLKGALRSVLEHEVHRDSLFALPARAVLRGHQGACGLEDSGKVASFEDDSQNPAFYEDRRFDYDLALGRLSKSLMQPMPADQIAASRRLNYQLLAETLASRFGPQPVFNELPEGTVPLCLPVWVDSSDRWMQALSARGVEGFVFGRHPHSLLPPQLTDSCEALRCRIVGLPVQQDLAPADIQELAERVADISEG